MISKEMLLEDLKVVLKEAKAMGCTEVKRFEHIQLEKIEMIINALEKQVAKKPIQQSTDEKTHYKCVCGNISMTVYTDGIRQGYTPNYCPNCGQKLDWSVIDEASYKQVES